MNRKRNKGWGPRTRMVRAGLVRSQFKETSEAIYMNSGYVYDSAEEAEEAFAADTPIRFVYSRYANPSIQMFEERLAAVEGAKRCQATASGMLAVWNALLACTKSGGRVVGSRALFGSCEHILSTLLPRFGVETELVDGTNTTAWKKALSKPADAVFIETPSNPTLEIIDLELVGNLAHNAGARLVVDNVFATPILQNPLEQGADLVVYSATKHIDGQGRTLSGAILGNDIEWFDEQLTPFVRHTGPTLSPFNAWILLKGLETLDLRVRQHCDNADRIAEFLSTHKKVKRVLFPGLDSHPQHELAMKQMKGRGGPIVAFELADREQAFATANRLEIIDLSNNLGDSRSLLTHPATTTHQRIGEEARAHLGISAGLLRLSVGLEDVEDLLSDLDQALA